MWEPPNDVPGKCNARLYIGDDDGDNYATVLCGLNPAHPGEHEETFKRGENREHTVTIRWPHDEGKLDE